MAIHAYSDDYLTSAQRILGDMLDFAVNTYDMDIDKFFEMFLVSNVSRQFEIGNPTYVAGKTGCELVKEVIRDSGLVMEEYPDEMYWINHQNIGVAGHWPIISGIEEEHFHASTGRYQ